MCPVLWVHIKNFKVFFFIFILTYIILGFFPGCFLYPKAGVLFVWVISVFFVLLTLFPFFRFCSRLPPDKRGQLTVYILSFCNKTSGDGFFAWVISLFLFLLYKTINSFSLVSASPELGGKCRARRGDRGMLAYTGQNYFGVLPILIISILMCLLTLAPSDGLRFVIFPLFPVMQGQFFVCFL